MLGWLTGKSKAKTQRTSARQIQDRAARLAKRMVSAKFDSAQTTEEDRRYWTLVDNLSADASLSPEVRRIVRNRARYEAGNGGYCKGMVKQKSNDLVGTGPRLQMLTKNATDQNEKLEKDWKLWSRKTLFARTLRTACRCKVRDGAALGLIKSNPMLPTKAKVQFRLIDIDRLHTPDLTFMQPDRVDGIDYDEFDNPIRYWILDEHPGSTTFSATQKATPYPASAIVHWFDEDRAEQHHGLSELAPSLRTFGNHRRFLKATIRAAEIAAEIAAFFTNNNPPDEDMDDAEFERKALEVLDMEFGGIMVAPDGDDVKQIKSEHPNTNFGEFNKQIVTEEARPLLMPSNIANGSSAGYNYASGRLDNQSYDRDNDIDRDDLVNIIIEPVFEQWLRETLSEMSGIAPSDIDLDDYEHEWHWDTRDHVDPSKNSASQDKDLRNGSLTFPTLYAKQGKDWRKEFQKQADSLGITLAEFQTMVRRALYEQSLPATSAGDDEDGDDEDGQEAKETAANAAD